MSNNNNFCPLDDTIDEFQAPGFSNTAAIEWMHTAPPRFGHDSDLNGLIDGSQDDGKDYIIGLLAPSIAMFCFFSVWITTILLLKCCGRKRVGFWSGSITPVPAEPAKGGRLEDHLEHRAWGAQRQATKRRMTIMRLIVLFAGASIITCAGLMVSQGVSSLVDTLDGGRNFISIAISLTQQGIDLIDGFFETYSQAQNDTVRLLEATNGFCPNVREELCEDIITDSTNCNFEGIPYSEEIQIVIDAVHVFQGDAFLEVFNFREDLVSMLEAAEELDQKASTFNWAFYVAASFAIALAVLCFIMMIGVCLAWAHRLPKIFYCFRSFVIVPLFMLLVFLSWIFSMVFVIGSMALADTCIDSPDEKVLNLIDKLKGDVSSMIAEILIFYVSGCPAASPPLGLVDELEKIKVSLPEFFTFVTTLRNAKEQIENVCGVESSLITLAADTVANSLCRMGGNLQSIRLFFYCDNWYPLYESITYETLCYSGTEGFAWVASAQFVIVFMTMIILTLRITFYEDQEEISGESHQEEVVNPSETSLQPSQIDDPYESQKVPSSEDDEAIPWDKEPRVDESNHSNMRMDFAGRFR